MYARIASSSTSTVDTEYPLAQKFWPVKFFLRPTKVLAIWIALLPLIKPTTVATAYFGGIDSSM